MIVQIAGVSQISLLGVSADLTPLVVMSVGLLCRLDHRRGDGLRRRPAGRHGAAPDARRLLADLLAVGYGAGRLRELRDPAHGLTPLAVGAAATAVATIGFSLMQFLLGVDAPVSWLLVRDILVDDRRQRAARAAGLQPRAPRAAAAPARRPAPPPPPRLHDRRPEPDLAR